MLCRLLTGFLLVTSRRLAVLAQASAVVWSSPAPGDRFSSGDTIIGKWQTSERVVSPSFGLCTAGENDCGTTVWPEVKESAGYYLVSLAVPNVNNESAYYLRMKDDFGHTYSSPIFTLTSYLQNENKPAAVPPDVAQPPQSESDQAPMSSPNGSPNPAPVDPVAPPAPGPSSAAVPHPVATSGPLVAAAHSAPPTAALAVPLSLAGAIIVLAGGLALHHRRRLAAEKERAREKLARSTSRLRSTGLALNLGGGGIYKGADDADVDVEKALFARGGALFRGGSGGFFPDHAADACYSRAAAGTAPLYPYYVPEPRRQTRHLALDLLPTRWYRRPRPPPPPLSSSSASPSLRHGYRDVGIADRSRRSRHIRGSGSSNGGGSLWRSLSISRHRRKVVPPSVASPSMTESVTSEVLPSYLPSPDFVDRSHPSQGAGDFEFEDVPLSPPPLHTREEAAEPDDSRMKELRGVYEAVSRALGSTHVG
ncbi:hypothetical protein EI94DRAFT_1810153 [Lactarius quietus]|nr:hypothetical protein EI94DRAFT_1810153 [Lactarius quietus]